MNSANPECNITSSFQILSFLRRTISPEIDYCITNYVNNIPKGIKDFIYREFDKAGRQSIQYFYEYLMTTMAEALSQGLTVVGFKVRIGSSGLS